MKPFAAILTLFLILFLATSCDKCPDDENLGPLALGTTSKSFLAYTGDETLVFVNGSGAEQRFSSQEGETVRQGELVIDMPCDEGVVDRQRVFYEDETFQIAFQNEQGNPAFSYTLGSNFVEEAGPEDVLTYDYFTLEGSFKGVFLGSFKVLASDRGNEIPALYQEETFPVEFVSDTFILGKQFQNVYFAKSSSRTGIFFQKDQGVIAMQPDTFDIWVLDRIE